jgi:hypothetical protein
MHAPERIPASGRVHHSLASLLSKGVLELRSVVLREVVAHYGLTTIFVYPL